MPEEAFQVSAADSDSRPEAVAGAALLFAAEAGRIEQVWQAGERIELV